MGGLGLRMVGGALAGIGDGILADAKAKKQTMLLQLEHQLRAGDQQANWAHEDKAAATTFANQKTLEQMRLDAGDEDIQSVVTDNTGSLVGVTKRGVTKPLGVQSGKPMDTIKDKFQDDKGNWYGVTESGKTMPLNIKGRLPENASDRPIEVQPGNTLVDKTGKVIYQSGLGIGGPGTGDLHGEEFLKTLDPSAGTTIKALADGRLQFPSGAALRSPYWQKMLEGVSQYDPSFDAVNYNSRSKTRGDFTSGKSAVNIKSLNTAIGHLGTLSGQVAETASHEGLPGATLLNRGINAVERSRGDPGVTNFEQTASALASELTTVFRGAGGAEADVKRYLDQLSVNASESQKRGAIKNLTDLLDSRLQAIGDQYDQGMGKSSDPLMLLSSKAADTLQALRSGKIPTSKPLAPSETTITPSRPAPPSAASPSSSQAPAPAAPTRATIPAPQNLLSEPDGTIVEDDQHRRYEKRGSQLIPR